MSPTTRQRLLVWVGYPSFALTSFLVAAYLTFPYDHLRDYIIQEVEHPRAPGGERRDSGLRLEIAELSPSFVTGVDLEGVRLTRRPAPAADTLPVPGNGATQADADAKPMVLEIDALSARISLLSLLTGTVAVSFDAELAGGEIEGAVAVSDDETQVELAIEDIDLRRLGAPSAALGLPITGKLGGTVDLTVGKEASATKGSVDLAIDGVVVGDGRAKLKLEGMGAEGLTVGRIEVGKIVVRAGVENGVARFTKLGTEGGRDVTVTGSGQLRLVHPIRGSRLELLVGVKFSDAFKTRDARTRGLFAMLDVVPRLRAARTADGALQWQIAGPLTGPFRPTPAGATRPAR